MRQGRQRSGFLVEYKNRKMSKVYFIKLKNKTPENLRQAGEKIVEIFPNLFNSEDKVAIKLHFGERGSQTSMSPVLTKAVYDNLKNKVKEAVLVDCTVLYKGDRSFASTHKELARDQGFDFAPVLIPDGERGREEIKVPVNLKHFKEVRIGAGMKDYNGILVLTHFTGHTFAGIGGSLKNIGMGLGSKGGKLEMHQHFKLKVNSEVCIGCAKCVSECSADAISLQRGKALIDLNKCIGCGICVSICPQGAIERPFGECGTAEELQERIVEYAAGALKNKKTLFVNVLLDITALCDCLKNKDETLIVPNIGILVSEDIVSIEKASLDLIGEEKFLKPDMNPSWQIDYAEDIGLGKKEYELIEVLNLN